MLEMWQRRPLISDLPVVYGEHTRQSIETLGQRMHNRAKLSRLHGEGLRGR